MHAQPAKNICYPMPLTSEQIKAHIPVVESAISQTSWTFGEEKTSSFVEDANRPNQFANSPCRMECPAYIAKNATANTSQTNAYNEQQPSPMDIEGDNLGGGVCFA